MFRRVGWFGCLVCVFGVGLSAGALRAVADSITLDYLTPYTAIPASWWTEGIDLTTLPDNSDWLLGSGNRKLGGTALSTTCTNTYREASWPTCTYTGGVSPPYAANEDAMFTWPGGNGGFDLTAHVGPGSGSLTIWMYQGTYNWGELSADLASTAGADLVLEMGPNGGLLGAQQIVLKYTSAINQDLTIHTATANNYSPYGFFAAALTPVPEPGALSLLGCGAAGLLAYAWRRRR